jgi:hypothetical protein
MASLVFGARALRFAALTCLGISLCVFAGCSGGASNPQPTSPLPDIQSFAASSLNITAGQAIALLWSVTGAQTVEISGVTATPQNSIVVAPAETTTYTLTATNTFGAVAQSLTVTVQTGSALGTATINAANPGLQIPATFLGFSHEWTGGPQLMGQPGSTNPIYRQLVKNLLAYGAGPLIVRIGGNSTDTTGEPATGVVAPFEQLHQDIGAEFYLGVNLGSDNVQLATDQAQAYVTGMAGGGLEAIEIGNEPDLYHSNGDRPTTYTFANYFSDFATWRTAILPLLPQGVKLMGPSWSSTSSLSNLPAFLTQESGNLSVVSQHWYAGTQCNGKTNPADFLLQASSATSGPKAVASSVPLAHQDSLPFRMGEMNSISCGGETGVSDTFASALWAADSMFEFANDGVDGVNFHNGNGGGYALFQFNIAGSGNATTYSIESVRPEYYGLLFFQQATANGARLLPVTLSTSANLKVWATVDKQGVVRVALLNKDESAEGDVVLTLPGYGSATLTRLRAPSYQATTGITLAGQTFDTSVDGTPQGIAYGEPVSPSGGTYTVAMPITSAAILTIQP